MIQQTIELNLVGFIGLMLILGMIIGFELREIIGGKQYGYKND